MNNTGGAFLTASFTSTNQPSMFEVTAQQSLSKTLGPACRHLIKVAATSQPEQCGFLTKVQDEVLLLANAALQLHYLKVYNSSFTENFYGLERIAVNSSEQISINSSFLSLVLTPYLRRKLETLFLKFQENKADGINPSNPILAKMRNLYISVFPCLHLAVEAVDIGFLLAFSLRKNKYHNLLAWLVGVYLVYVTPDKQKEKENRKLETIQDSSGLKHMAIISVSRVSRVLTFSLEVGSFFLQFLDWWYTQGDGGSEGGGLGGNRTIPKPPPTITELPTIHGTCPICRRKRKGDTVLATSGLVFCYTCIVHHLRKEARCPITRLPAMEEQLIRIFSPE